jgi:hypothetical protein
LVRECLAKDPAIRPTTADLLRELGAFQPPAGWPSGRSLHSLQSPSTAYPAPADTTLDPLDDADDQLLRELDQTDPNLGAIDPGTKTDVVIRIFLDDESAAAEVEAALREVLRNAGIDVVHRSDPIIGSWFLVLTGVLRRALVSDEVEETLARKLEADHADQNPDVARLIAALEHTKKASICIGRILLVKVDDTIVVERLSARKMRRWERDHPELFRDPPAALAAVRPGLCPIEKPDVVSDAQSLDRTRTFRWYHLFR